MIRSRRRMRTILSVMAAAAVAAIVVPPMLALTTVIGPTQVSGGGQTHRFPDVAYDSLNNIYLVTWGLTPAKGRFIDADGNPVGNPFIISQSGTDPAATRVAYSPEADAFFVVWLNENPLRVLGRFIRYSNGIPQFLTNTATGTANEFQIAAVPGLHTESAPTLAYSPVAREFLVTWVGFTDVFGQKVDSTGGFRGPQIPIAATANWEGLPDVAYNSAQDEYFVVFWDETPAGAMSVSGQRVGTGDVRTLIGSRTGILSGNELYAQVAYDSFRNRYLVITWHSGANSDVFGRLVSGVDGQAIGGPIPLATSGNFEGGDGIGLTYSAMADAYFGVFQFSAAAGNPPNDEIWGVEVSGDGVPQSPIQVTATGTRLAHQPQIAPSARQGRFLAVAGLTFSSVGSQLLEVAGIGPPPTRIISVGGDLGFGNVQVNTTATRTLTIGNSGNSALTVSSISYPTGFSGTWSGTLAAAGSQNVTVTFAPTSPTSYGGTVTVNADQTSGTNTITASGTGTPVPTRIISVGGDLGFGNVQANTTATRTMTISNSGDSALTVSSISYPMGFSGAWSGTVAAAGSQNVTVTFAPTSPTSYGGTVTVSADQTSGSNTIAASGTGTPVPFTDASLLVGIMTIRVVHVAELRTRVDALRAKFGLEPFPWIDATLIAEQTQLRAVHFTELRAALDAAYVAARRTPPAYTDPVLTPGQTIVKAEHVMELRAAVVALE